MTEENESIKTFVELLAKVQSISGDLIDGQLSPDASLMVMNKNTAELSTITEIHVERDEETGLHTVWLMTEDY